jgi:mannose-6-phosphate isomerase-like protein (cupin superfamily)
MQVRHLEECTEFTAGDGSILREIFNPHKENLALNYSIAWARVKPGEKTLRHRLEHSEVYFIIKGSGIIYINNEEKLLIQHDTVYIPAQAIQHIKNNGVQDLEFLCIVDPAWQPKHEEILE